MSLQDELLDQELTDTLTIEYRKRGQTRCAALVNPNALNLRGMQYTSRRCRRGGAIPEHGHWFCRQHAPMWRTHYDILDRIREIPVRS